MDPKSGDLLTKPNTKKHLLSHCRVIGFLVCLSAAPAVHSQGSDTQYEAGFQQHINVFSRTYDAQYQSSFHIGTNRFSGSWQLRLHRGSRFDQNAYQWELVGYPVLSDRLYAYVAYAFSDSKIFPRHRSGAELFSSLPLRSEGSLGLRYLNFETVANGNNETVLITASLNHYFGAYMATVRPFFIFSEGGSGQTWLGSLRRFLNDEGDYVMIRGASGRSSDEILFQVGQNVEKDFLLLKSSQIGLESRYHLTKRISGNAALTLYRQELSFDPGQFVNNWSIRTGLNVHW